jgi:hypothetical protein
LQRRKGVLFLIEIIVTFNYGFKINCKKHMLNTFMYSK